MHRAVTWSELNQSGCTLGTEVFGPLSALTCQIYILKEREDMLVI